LEDHFPQKDQFQRKVPLIFHFGKTSDDLCGEPYDLVFIDGDHSYMWMKKDFLNIGRYANICCFHDIKAHEYDHLGGGTVRCWRELKESYREKASIIEISHSGPYWMGIGMIFLSEPIRGETSALLRSAQEHKGNIGR
jgi:hypothetical protein